jgi:phosphoenolpyruvate carboxykinase (GTP)
VIPLVMEAFDWTHGTFLGSIMSSAKTAAAAGTVGEVRRDPMAMLPFCGYHMGDYFAHWLRTGEHEGARLPRIFYVNWFRKDADGRFLWPGFGDNSRVLKWVFDRIEGATGAVETPIGRLPEPGALDVSGLDLAEGALDELLSVDIEGWRQELPLIEEHYAKFGDRLPADLREQLDELERRLADAG